MLALKDPECIIDRMNFPSEQDFLRLDEMVAMLEALDQSKLEAARALFRRAVPPPYDEMLAPGQLQPTLESRNQVSEAIENDPNLFDEERVALKFEASERWRAVVIGQAGEGFND
jgi:hypothetical protein